MEGDEQLLDDDIYDMISQDLSQGSNRNFSSLVASPAPTEQRVVDNHVRLPYQDDQRNYFHVENHHSNLQYPNNFHREQVQEQRFDGQHIQQTNQEQQLVQNYPDTQPSIGTPWDLSEEMTADVIGTGLIGDSSLPPVLPPVLPQPAFIPDGVPSLKPWSGQFNFTVSMLTDNKDRNKWCYSPILNKLFVVQNLTVPLDISVNPLVEGTVTITPVFKQSQHMKKPVHRCYNCKTMTDGGGEDKINHIVQLESTPCQYRILPDERAIVTAPLPLPSPGENRSTILIKIMCLTSCVGGPNRRPFCLVLTLHCSNTGRLIGRQVLDVKCCACPHRDMGREEDLAVKNRNNVSNNTINTQNHGEGNQNLDERTGQRIRKLASQIQVGKKRKRTRTIELEIISRPEPVLQPGFVNIAVPVEFEEDVKKFVNGLLATMHLRRDRPDLLLYPEVADDSTESERESDSH
ncbi:uncharacterized protein [Palaemon carinicauda]|uniref:uncharacterized protein n=1 Tax=Palaemon carinicauda TaxID=392227 RepID=UPI0035B625FE